MAYKPAPLHGKSPKFYPFLEPFPDFFGRFCPIWAISLQIYVLFDALFRGLNMRWYAKIDKYKVWFPVFATLEFRVFAYVGPNACFLLKNLIHNFF